MGDRFLIFIPTYNERENIEPIYQKIKQLGLGCDFLFLDDNSPDGTGIEMDRLAAADKMVTVIHRKEKLGIGGAHLDGIRWAYAHGYKRLVTMDCDFTHQPEDITLFLEAGEKHDVVIGSRFMDKKSLSDWNLFRKALTHLGHFTTKHFLELPYDATGAFRLYRLDQISSAAFEKVTSRGYAFFFESLYVLFVNHYKIKEISILLPARTYGHSKMTLRDSLKSLSFIFSLYSRSHFHKKTLICGYTQPASPSDSELEWNTYWSGQENRRSGLYGYIAHFYRKNIIRRTLNRMTEAEFQTGAELLHAGCGSGQVDTEVVRIFRVTALDISSVALEKYRGEIGAAARTVRGSILEIPAAEGSFDGVYNLGVMEHFDREHIRRILLEFRRVLKPGGKVLLFWPPTFGLSVRVLDSVHFIANKVFNRKLQLHPYEISRLESKEDARRTLGLAGFELTRYYFGPMDLFTHAILVGRKAA